MWVDNFSFNDNNTYFESEFSYHGSNEKYTVIVAMNDSKKDYKVFVDGEETEYSLRDNSAIEIVIKGDKATRNITIK